MNHRLEKNLKILNELIICCFKRGGRNMDMNLTFEEDVSLFTLSGEVDGMSPESVDRISRQLNEERQREVEENYWTLGGDSELNGESEMFLVGIMIDEATVTYENGRLYIHAVRFEP